MRLKSKVTKTIGFIFDEIIPPILRDNKWFYWIVVKVWNSKIDLDFKTKAFYMSEDQFIDAYEKISPMRETDNTKKTISFVLNNLKGENILEVGCGNGDMSIECVNLGYKVMATDLASCNLEIVTQKAENAGVILDTKECNIEKIPFNDNSFDTTICLHTLEHVRNLNLAINELKRVTRKRIIIIVPKQKYFRYTADYHLNFFHHPSQLIRAIGLKNARCVQLDFCLCYYGDFNTPE